MSFSILSGSNLNLSENISDLINSPLCSRTINKFKNDPKCLLIIKKNEKFSRNEKCPATGKKYKYCCGVL